jgi:hypothetical protein
MPDRRRSRPRDPNQLAKLVVDIATGEAKNPPLDTEKDQVAVALGRRRLEERQGTSGEHDG